jgi:hypothetical protein
MSKMKDYMMKNKLHLGDKTFDIKSKMPNPVLKKYAEKAHTTIDKVEEMWEKAKEVAANSVGKTSPQYWATVNSITQKMLKLKESTTFKDCLLSEEDDS